MPKVRDVIQRLEQEGWILRRTRGDHRQYYHPESPERRVTIAGQRNDDLPPGTWNSIQKQAGWKQETDD